MQRAQRDADRVFYWVRLHGNAPAKAATEQAATATPTPTPKSAAAPRPLQARQSGQRTPPASASVAQPEAQPLPIATLDYREPQAVPPDSDEPATPDVKVPAGSTPFPTAAPAQAQAQAVAEADAQGKAQSPAPAPASASAAAASPTRAEPERAAEATTEPADSKPGAPEPGLVPTTTQPRTSELQPINQPSPDFPPDLVQSLKRGTVKLQFIVMPDGSVASPEVIATSHEQLVASALVAVRQWRFRPQPRSQAAQVDLSFGVD